MGPIDHHAPPGTYETYFILFLELVRTWKNGCHHHQIGMDYLCDAIFKMAAIEISGITFSPITQVSRIDRDTILVSKPMFMWMRNPMIALKYP